MDLVLVEVKIRVGWEEVLATVLVIGQRLLSQGMSVLLIPPALGSGVMVIHIMPLGQTGLDYFLSGGVHTTFSRMLDASTNKLLASARSVGFSGGGGLLKRLETDFGWSLNPFCGTVFSEAGTNLDTKDGSVEVRGNPTFFNFVGGVGLEIELSPMISIVGGFQISLKDFYRGFSIGLNFH